MTGIVVFDKNLQIKLISPTKGYEKIYGKISEITEEEYHILMQTAREFDEIRKVS